MVDQFNTEGKKITVDLKNITDNRIQRKKKYEKKEVCGKQKSVCLGDVCSQVLEVELGRTWDWTKKDALLLSSVLPQCRL